VVSERASVKGKVEGDPKRKNDTSAKGCDDGDENVKRGRRSQGPDNKAREKNARELARGRLKDLMEWSGGKEVGRSGRSRGSWIE